MSRDADELEIKFKEPDNPGYLKFNDTFSVAGIYSTQKDVAEELILKAEVYTESYRKSLIRDFPKIFTDANLTNRLIVGNYVDKNEIHRRPMSKFMQDLAKQLGLI